MPAHTGRAAASTLVVSSDVLRSHTAQLQLTTVMVRQASRHPRIQCIHQQSLPLPARPMERCDKACTVGASRMVAADMDERYAFSPWLAPARGTAECGRPCIQADQCSIFETLPRTDPIANEQSMHNLRQTRARLTDSLLARFENGRGNVSPETSSNFPSALPPFA